MGEIAESHRNAIDDVQDTFEKPHWIDNEAHSGNENGSVEIIDPTIDNPIVQLPSGGTSTVDSAVSAAERAVDDWSQRTPMERADLIEEWADTIAAHADELGLIETLDMGRPLTQSVTQADSAAEYIRYYARAEQAQSGEHFERTSDTHAYTRKEPYGVVGLILPWNYPLELFSWKVGAALATGNTVVVKPSNKAPLSVIRAAQLSADMFPPGVLNVVAGSGSQVGAALTEHNRVEKLSFTGSAPVGSRVMRTASETITPVTLELGGKNPYVVFPEADIEAAANTAAGGVFYNTGQSCGACSRILVHESVHDRFREAFLNVIDSDWQPGDPLADGTSMGPVAHRGQFEDVVEYVDVGESEGAELIYGGKQPNNETLSDGLFFEPTVFDNVDPEMRIAREEIFGPVPVLMPFSTYEEAIEVANGVDYGLSAGVATTDMSRAHRAAADLEAGSIWVNDWHAAGPGIPFGGFKQSGIGRECATETLEEYKQTKTVSITLED